MSDNTPDPNNFKTTLKIWGPDYELVFPSDQILHNPFLEGSLIENHFTVGASQTKLFLPFSGDELKVLISFIRSGQIPNDRKYSALFEWLNMGRGDCLEVWKRLQENLLFSFEETIDITRPQMFINEDDIMRCNLIYTQCFKEMLKGEIRTKYPIYCSYLMKQNFHIVDLKYVHKSGRLMFEQVTDDVTMKDIFAESVNFLEKENIKIEVHPLFSDKDIFIVDCTAHLILPLVNGSKLRHLVKEKVFKMNQHKYNQMLEIPQCRSDTIS